MKARCCYNEEIIRIEKKNSVTEQTFQHKNIEKPFSSTLLQTQKKRPLPGPGETTVVFGVSAVAFFTTVGSLNESMPKARSDIIYIWIDVLHYRISSKLHMKRNT